MKNLQFKLLNASVGAKRKVDEVVKNFVTRKHSGDSHFLAIAFGLLLVVALAGLFNTELRTAATNVFQKVTTNINSFLGN